MTISNISRWQKDRIRARLQIIEDTLKDIDERKLSFKKVTYLAKYIAEAISKEERRIVETIDGLDIPISSAKTCRASSLLKSKTYRARLNIWMRKNNHISVQESTELSDLRFRLLRLSNEHSMLKDELKTLHEICDRASHSSLITTERNDGMTIAQMLIQHFHQFCQIHDGALVEPSPGRPTIVPAPLFSAYLRWKSNVY